MRQRVQLSVPGKSILMGEHSVVYGRPALVAAVSLRLRIAMERARGGEIAIEVPALGLAETLTWEEVVVYATAARERWLRYRERPGPETFSEVQGSAASHLIQVALGETALFLRQEGGTSREPREQKGGTSGAEQEGGTGGGVRVRVDSEIPVGAGFGSSAAAAVGLVAAVLELEGRRARPEEIEALALEVERRQHGQPSGVDTAAVLRGGVIEARRRDEGGLEVTPLELRSPALAGFRLYHSGRPGQSTGEVVAAVRAWGERSPPRFTELLEAMGVATTDFGEALRRPVEDGPALLASIRRFEACLEELGVVPEALRRRIRGIEAAGGAAKVSGAGALGGPGAGSVLVYHPEPARLAGHGLLAGLEPLELELGAPGLARE